MKRPPLTIDEHGDAARLIRVASTSIARLLRMTSGRKGITAKTLDRLLKSDRGLNQVRSDLENLMFCQHRGATTDVYYPPAEG